MRGSYSIKKVLPALVPELSYSDLEISEGGTASNTFAEMVSGAFEGDIDKTRKDLLEYCKLDTYAMLEIVRVLHNIWCFYLYEQDKLINMGEAGKQLMIKV